MNFTLSFLLRSDKLVIGQHLLLSPASTAVKPAFSEFDHCPNPIQEGELCVCWCCWSRGVVCALRSYSWCAVQALSRHQSQSFVPFPPHFLRVSGALFNSSSCSARSSSRSRSLIRFLACCSQCRNPSCSRKCKSVSFSIYLSMSSAVASVLGQHCDLQDVIHAVLRVSGVVSILNCCQSAKCQKELVDPNEGGCVSA